MALNTEWYGFFCFGKNAKHGYSRACEWMPKVKYTLSAYNGKLNVSCKVEELVQYVADSSNSNQ